MTLAPSLLEQRLELREQLQAQRQEVTEQLFASKVEGQFPRSMTMQLLIRRPELLVRLLALVGGARLAGSATAIFVVVQMLRASRTPSSAP